MSTSTQYSARGLVDTAGSTQCLTHTWLPGLFCTFCFGVPLHTHPHAQTSRICGLLTGFLLAARFGTVHACLLAVQTAPACWEWERNTCSRCFDCVQSLPWRLTVCAAYGCSCVHVCTGSTRLFELVIVLCMGTGSMGVELHSTPAGVVPRYGNGVFFRSAAMGVYARLAGCAHPHVWLKSGAVTSERSHAGWLEVLFFAREQSRVGCRKVHTVVGWVWSFGPLVL